MGLILSVCSRRFEASGIFFDKDGTLVDLQHQYGQLMDRRLSCILSRLEKKRDLIEGQIAGAVGYDPVTRRVHPSGLLARSTKTETMGIIARVIEGQGYEGDQAREIVRNAFEEADQALRLDELTRPVDGALRLLSSLKDCGVPLACLTNDERKRAEAALGLLGMRSYFDLVLGGDESERPKPHPHMFFEACRLLDLEPGEVVMVGDTSADMNMARQGGAGLAVRITSEEDADEGPSDGSELHIRRLDEILILHGNGEGRAFLD